mmetsp:Transcript_57821/g.163174  ORF Transcript_57821/g.163174 Transcript_57821/m.163174 type:complete len:257 (+) Transcript_57821:261-1031(+)
MGAIAAAVYDFKEVAGWKLVMDFNGPKNFLNITDYMGVYMRDNVCAISFAGTDDVFDVVSELNVATVPLCGFRSVHRGFAEKLERILRTHTWQTELAPYLRSGACAEGVVCVGHSLGGALASILAACANSQESGGIGHLLGGLAVAGIYTFGAPAVSKGQLTDGRSSDGCFGGGRWYREDEAAFDPVPYLAHPLGFQHPRSIAIRMEDTGHGRAKREFECASREARDEPSTLKTPSIGYHALSSYLAIASSIYGPD